MGSIDYGARSFYWLGAVASTMLAGVSLAHHGFTNHFDPDQERVISGSVTEFRFINPHVTIHIDVQNDGEIEQWTVEMGGTSGLWPTAGCRAIHCSRGTMWRSSATLPVIPSSR